MPEPQNNSNDVKATDPREGIDRYRVSPELKFNRAIGPAVDGEIKSPRRDMPVFCESEFYAFGKPSQLGKPGLSNFRPDGWKSDPSNPQHAFDDENSKTIYREK